MTPNETPKVDLHCHSTASNLPRLGIQRSLGLPECATPPEEVHELAKRRGMDFVTITDHDTIDGVLEIADRPDVFISEELTAWFADEPQAVHVLCWGITAEDHEWLQENARDLEVCVTYLHGRGIACALAHPFFTVAAPLEPRHRRRLAELFAVWETRNGARAPELNQPAAIYIETHGGAGTGGSDDHAGVDIGRTFTETPAASTPEELLGHLHEGRTTARGEQGSAAKWAHSAMAIAIRSLVSEGARGEQPLDPAGVLRLAERVVSDGAARGGPSGGEFGRADARALLRAWLESIDLDSDPRSLIALMQDDGFSHADLYRRARRIHERRLSDATERATAAIHAAGQRPEAARAAFDALVPVVPYVPATAILGRELAKLDRREGERRRVGLVVDGLGSMHGVTRTVERVREHAIPGYEVEVIGTDPRVDRRLPAVAEVEIPFYPGLHVGVPSMPELAETLSGGRYDLIHLVSPGPAGVAAAIIGRVGGLPLVGSYHTELASYAGIRSDDAALEGVARAAVSLFYRQFEVVLSPSPAADRSLALLGVEQERLQRWTRGVDTLFDPARRDKNAFPGQFNILYAGRLSEEKGVELLAESFLRAHERDRRLRLVLAGGGPEERMLRERLGALATFLGWLDREQLARAYASADLFLFCSRTDTYGQVIVEAQASGLPVVAVAEGGPSSLIRDRHTGWLCQPHPEVLSAAVAQLAASRFLRERLARAALAEVRSRTWEGAFEQLADGYARVLGRVSRMPVPVRAREAA